MKSLIVIFVLSNLAISQSLDSTSADLNSPLVEKQNAEYLKKAEKTIQDNFRVVFIIFTRTHFTEILTMKKLFRYQKEAIIDLP